MELLIEFRLKFLRGVSNVIGINYKSLVEFIFFQYNYKLQSRYVNERIGIPHTAIFLLFVIDINLINIHVLQL